MSHDNRQRRPQSAGTVALLAASLLLALIGITLLAHRSPTAAPAPREPSSSPSTSASRAPGEASRSAAASQAPSTGSPSHSASAQQSAGAIPADVAAVARRFILAWASHDARPGKDASYDDAAERAAAYADRDLARQLPNSSASTARQWQQWTKTEARVSADITRIAIPDGAPAPSADTAWVRVRFRLTVSPAAGHTSTTDEQAALKLQRSADGHWLVTALPYV